MQHRFSNDEKMRIEGRESLVSFNVSTREKIGKRKKCDKTQKFLL